jgi:hypothetical protein
MLMQGYARYHAPEVYHCFNIALLMNFACRLGYATLTPVMGTLVGFELLEYIMYLQGDMLCHLYIL